MAGEQKPSAAAQAIYALPLAQQEKLTQIISQVQLQSTDPLLLYCLDCKKVIPRNHSEQHNFNLQHFFQHYTCPCQQVNKVPGTSNGPTAMQSGGYQYGSISDTVQQTSIPNLGHYSNPIAQQQVLSKCQTVRNAKVWVIKSKYCGSLPPAI